jgi:hypothetical protein
MATPISQWQPEQATAAAQHQEEVLGHQHRQAGREAQRAQVAVRPVAALDHVGQEGRLHAEGRVEERSGGLGRLEDALIGSAGESAYRKREEQADDQRKRAHQRDQRRGGGPPARRDRTARGRVGDQPGQAGRQQQRDQRVDPVAPLVARLGGLRDQQQRDADQRGRDGQQRHGGAGQRARRGVADDRGALERAHDRGDDCGESQRRQ